MKIAETQRDLQRAILRAIAAQGSVATKDAIGALLGLLFQCFHDGGRSYQGTIDDLRKALDALEACPPPGGVWPGLEKPPH